jgi:RNA polymerase sigma-70 factor (ECF subfamily)
MTGAQDFERVALPHLDAACNLANWLVRNSSDAEDVVQDAYVRAFRAFDQFAGGDIRPWLLTIVRNVAYRWLSVRKRAANVISIEDAFSARDDRPGHPFEPASPEPSAEEVLLGRAEHALVRRALEELPPAFREVVVLRDLEGLSYRDIAAVTDTPIGTVMSRLARARQRLKEQVAQLRAKEDQDAL